MCKVNFLDRDAGCPFWEKNGAYSFGSSKQNTHICIYIQESDNGVPLNYYRFREQTGLLFSVRLSRLHGYV